MEKGSTRLPFAQVSGYEAYSTGLRETVTFNLDPLKLVPPGVRGASDFLEGMTPQSLAPKDQMTNLTGGYSPAVNVTCSQIRTKFSGMHYI